QRKHRKFAARIEKCVDEQASEGIDGEYANQGNRGADRAGDECVALDPSVQCETLTEQDQRGRGEDRRAVTQSGLTTRQVAEDKRKQFPRPAVDVDRERDRRNPGESGYSRRNERARNRLTRLPTACATER